MSGSLLICRPVSVRIPQRMMHSGSSGYPIASSFVSPRRRRFVRICPLYGND